jgi:hypothetical protein
VKEEVAQRSLGAVPERGGFSNLLKKERMEVNRSGCAHDIGGAGSGRKGFPDDGDESRLPRKTWS